MNILHLKQKIGTYYHKDRSKLYIAPGKDWMIILLLVSVSLVGVFVFGYNTYNKYYIHSADQAVPEKSAQEASKIKVLQTKLTDTIVYFEQKDQEHTKLLKTKKTFENMSSTTTKSGGSTPQEEMSSDETNSETIPQNDDVKTKESNEASLWKAIFIDLIK